jgi:hypothetical protein
MSKEVYTSSTSHNDDEGTMLMSLESDVALRRHGKKAADHVSPSDRVPRSMRSVSSFVQTIDFSTVNVPPTINTRTITYLLSDKKDI